MAQAADEERHVRNTAACEAYSDVTFTLLLRNFTPPARFHPIRMCFHPARTYFHPIWMFFHPIRTCFHLPLEQPGRLLRVVLSGGDRLIRLKQRPLVEVGHLLLTLHLVPGLLHCPLRGTHLVLSRLHTAVDLLARAGIRQQGASHSPGKKSEKKEGKKLKITCR
eukprot:1187011-Prorocentrum_minimum.AAC.2